MNQLFWNLRFYKFVDEIDGQQEDCFVELEIPAEEKSKNPAEAFEVVEGLEINGPGLPHSDSETSIDRQLEHEKWNRKPCFY